MIKEDDLIYRNEAIDALIAEVEENGHYRRAIRVIKNLPSAQPEQRWIPCSERLPEKPNIYTVTDNKGIVGSFAFYDTESSRDYWLRYAKAWMPPPKPYSEEGDE